MPGVGVSVLAPVAPKEIDFAYRFVVQDLKASTTSASLMSLRALGMIYNGNARQILGLRID